MNTETREIRDASQLTPADKASGKWIPVHRKYVKRQPISDADHARILAAEQRRLRRAAKRRPS